MGCDPDGPMFYNAEKYRALQGWRAEFLDNDQILHLLSCDCLLSSCVMRYSRRRGGRREEGGESRYLPFEERIVAKTMLPRD